MKPIPLAIVEDDPIIRESLRTFLGGDPQFDLLYTAVSIEDFLQALETDARIVPAVILLDIQLPGMSGIEGIPSIKKLRPGVDVIMLDNMSVPDMAEAVGLVAGRVKLEASGT